MQAHHADLEAAGARIVAVAATSVEESRTVANELGIEFPLLADVSGDVIRAYGVLHEGGHPFGAELPMARPAVFLLDGAGVARARFLTENWRVRERAEHLLEELAKLPAR